MDKISKPLTVLVTGGGTAGHISPLRSLAHEIKRQAKDSKLVYIGFSKDQFDNLLGNQSFDNIYKISAGKFRRYPQNPKTWFLNLRDGLRVALGIWQAWRLMGKLKPDVVFSKGGFVAVPVAISAWLRRVPIVTHDSDAVPGLANRLASRWAKVNATGLPTELYSYPADKMVFTGVPIDEKFFTPTSSQRIQRAKRELGLPPNSKVLLILGGSLGADKLNQVIPEISSRLFADIPGLEIIHVSGASRQAATQSNYQSCLDAGRLKKVKILPFADDVPSLMVVADLVVSRAGATVIAELAASKKPAVIVPSPYLASEHQLKNAEWLLANGAVSKINNNAETPAWQKNISDLLADNHRRVQLSNAIGKLAKPEAASSLAELIISVARREI